MGRTPNQLDLYSLYKAFQQPPKFKVVRSKTPLAQILHKRFYINFLFRDNLRIVTRSWEGSGSHVTGNNLWREMTSTGWYHYASTAERLRQVLAVITCPSSRSQGLGPRTVSWTAAAVVMACLPAAHDSSADRLLQSMARHRHRPHLVIAELKIEKSP